MATSLYSSFFLPSASHRRSYFKPFFFFLSEGKTNFSAPLIWFPLFFFSLWSIFVSYLFLSLSRTSFVGFRYWLCVCNRSCRSNFGWFSFSFFRVLSRFWFFFALNILGCRVLFYFLVYRCFLLVLRAMLCSYVLPADIRFGTDSFGLLCASILSREHSILNIPKALLRDLVVLNIDYPCAPKKKIEKSILIF